MASTDRVVQWRGGSLDELVGMLSGPALAARIEVVIPEAAGRPERVVGEVHMVAGGVADAISGSLRGEDAMAQLQRLPMATFRVEPCVPEPESGGIVPPGPEEGQLAKRPLASLMRYCEQYAMTCLLEVWRGGDQATINYRRGEIVSTTVDGSDAAERLPEVMTWTEGQYRIVLPPLVLPASPRAGKPVQPAQPPAATEQRTLFGYVPPVAIPPPEAPHRPAESILRQTFPVVTASAEGQEGGHRPTRPGLPVDIYDAAVPERITDVGVPALPNVDPDKTPLPQPSEPRLPVAPAPAVLTTLPDRGPIQHRATAPGFVPAKPDSLPTLSGGARESRPVIASPRSSRRVAVRRRTLSDLPVVVHVGLGLALGLAIVGAYWVAQGLFPH
jgi:hypothetical protein